MHDIKLIHLKLFKSYQFSGLVLIIAALAIIMVAIYNYGGVFSITFAWLPAVPITATFLVGRRIGLA